jgi:hypothetical protein
VGFADPARGAGDQRDLSLQSSRHDTSDDWLASCG